MKKLGMVAGSVVGAFLLFAAVVVAINALDEPLSPAAQDLVKGNELDVKPSEGYDFLLGLTAPANEDPLIAGRKIREESQRNENISSIRLRLSTPKEYLQVTSESKNCAGVADRPVYCGKDWYNAHAAEVETLAKENAALLARFDKLTNFASLNTDPSSRNLVDSNVMQVQRLLRIKQDIWGLKWANGDKESVIKEWTESNRFFNRWLEATPITMIETTIVLHLLGTQKNFALEILKSEPTATTYFSSANLLSLKPTVSFERLKNKVAVSEFSFFHVIARSSPNVGSILGASFGGGPRDPASALYKVPVPLIKWNATLNAYAQRALAVQNDPCVTDANPCKASSEELKFTINNPIGNFLVTALNPTSPIYEKMYQRYSDLSEVAN